MPRRSVEERLESCHSKAFTLGNEKAKEDCLWAIKTYPHICASMRQHAMTCGVDFSKKPKTMKRPEPDTPPMIQDIPKNPEDVPENDEDRIPGCENCFDLLKLEKLKRVLCDVNPEVFTPAAMKAMVPKGRRQLPREICSNALTYMCEWESNKPFGGVRSVHYLIVVMKKRRADHGNRGQMMTIPPNYDVHPMWRLEKDVTKRLVTCRHTFKNNLSVTFDFNLEDRAGVNMDELRLESNFSTGACTLVSEAEGVSETLLQAAAQNQVNDDISTPLPKKRSAGRDHLRQHGRLLLQPRR